MSLRHYGGIIGCRLIAGWDGAIKLAVKLAVKVDLFDWSEGYQYRS